MTNPTSPTQSPPAAPPDATAEALPTQRYPELEAFIETATPEDVAGLFESIKLGLAELKGPKKPLAAKVEKALARTEEVLAQLIEVREKLLEEQGSRAHRK